MIPTGIPEPRVPYLVYCDTGWDVQSYEEEFINRLGYKPDTVFRYGFKQIWIGPAHEPLPINFDTNIPADA